MILITPLLVLTLALPSLGSSIQQVAAGSYGASVTFERGECLFWTGDVAFNAAEFQHDLMARFDTERRLVISHAKNTPTRCVELALRAAKGAGFERVDTEVREDAGPIGPPLTGK